MVVEDDSDEALGVRTRIQDEENGCEVDGRRMWIASSSRFVWMDGFRRRTMVNGDILVKFWRSIFLGFCIQRSCCMVVVRDYSRSIDRRVNVLVTELVWASTLP